MDVIKKESHHQFCKQNEGKGAVSMHGNGTMSRIGV